MFLYRKNYTANNVHFQLSSFYFFIFFSNGKMEIAVILMWIIFIHCNFKKGTILDYFFLFYENLMKRCRIWREWALWLNGSNKLKSSNVNSVYLLFTLELFHQNGWSDKKKKHIFYSIKVKWYSLKNLTLDFVCTERLLEQKYV